MRRRVYLLDIQPKIIDAIKKLLSGELGQMRHIRPRNLRQFFTEREYKALRMMIDLPIFRPGFTITDEKGRRWVLERIERWNRKGRRKRNRVLVFKCLDWGNGVDSKP